MSIQEAFFTVCNEALPAKSIYVSLYIRVPRYGGPEEGGWWTSDTHLVAYQQFSSQEAADAAALKVTELAEELNKQARDDFGRACQAQLDWCEARGIDDANYIFGEVDGEEDYFVVQEASPGQHEYCGPTHYE